MDVHVIYLEPHSRLEHSVIVSECPDDLDEIYQTVQFQMLLEGYTIALVIPRNRMVVHAIYDNRVFGGIEK